MKLGVLDIGTNSIHLVLVEIRKDLTIDILDRAKEITRLGDTSFQEGYLSEAAIHRGISAVSRFKKLADIHGITKIKAVATSAVREAANGGDLIEMIERETGIQVNVITGEEEARLIYLAVKHSISLSKTPSLIVDIGGGSVELILTDEEGVKDCWSLKLGTLRLKGDFIQNDPPSRKELQKMQDYILETLKPILKKARAAKVGQIIGTSGTIINLVTMANWQDQSTPIEIQGGFRIKTRYLNDIHKLLTQSSQKERLKIKGIDATRVDIIIPGSAVLKTLIDELDISELTLCDEAIREGVVYDYLERNRSKIEMEAQFPDIRLRSVLQLAKKCDFREKHAKHVSELALSLFDQMKPLHDLGPYERELLRYAALLHDIGYHINYKRHHRHSYYLIKNGDLNGFEEREVEIIANIARYHSKSYPKKSHEGWKKLSDEDRKMVKTCAAILRLADGLDRSHFSVIHQVQARINGTSIALDIVPGSDPELELWAANKKKDLFEEVFQKKVNFVMRSGKALSSKTKELKRHA